MSTRTKSSIEQDQRKQRNEPWNRPHTNRQPLGNAPTNVASKPKPHIAATAQAKSKLQAFRVVAGDQKETERPQDDEKAEIPTVQEGEKSGDLDKDSSAGEPSKDSQKSHRTMTFPCTPGARLPLQDLIGNFDEAEQEELTRLSPQEQIGWIPNSSANPLTPNQRKKRPRAKSSSPPCPTSSAQLQDSSTPKVPDPVIRTPAADPASDLWQRYGHTKQSSDSMQLPEISNLIFHGSPRPLETPVKSGGLRRWASTGNEWPDSRSKRRCTNSRASINVWQDRESKNPGDKQKVASMVQKIQHSLVTQRQERVSASVLAAVTADCPSSSSPLPDTGLESFAKSQVVSPLQARKTAALVHGKGGVSLHREPALEESLKSSDPDQASGAVKQIGDPMDPGAAPTYSLRSRAPLPAYKRPSITRVLSQQQVQQTAASTETPVAENSHDDEFGDDEFDLTVDDIDALCSQIPPDKTLDDIPKHPGHTLSGTLNSVVRQTQPLQQAPIIDLVEDDEDEFGGDIDEDTLVQAEYSASQAFQISPKKCRLQKSPRKGTPLSQVTQTSAVHVKGSRLRRYVVKQVVEGEFTDEKGRISPEKLLMAEDERTRSTVAITLRGSWQSTPVAPQAIVHVAQIRRRNPSAITSNPPLGQIVISDHECSPLLILHPDHMLSATTVADSFDCARKAVLQDRIKATGETSKAMIYGKILHEIFQQALSANQWSESFLAELVDTTIQAHVEGLWELGMQDNSLAAEEIKAKMSEMTAWARIFIQPEPDAAALVDDKQGEKVLMSISKLIAIEEHVWSPQFGLKGNVDATVQTTMASRPGAPELTNLIVPFEVKTGRTTQSAAHRAQTALYTLLMSDRYDVAVEAGVLYYLESSSMSLIAPPLTEIRQMIQQRNRLAAYIFSVRNPSQDLKGALHQQDLPLGVEEVELSHLPPMLRNPFKCGRCYAQQSCFTYHALVEDGTSESAGMVDDSRKNHSATWKEALGHLALDQKDKSRGLTVRRWFTKWDKLLTFEESNQSRLRKELWTMSSAEREAAGRCFGNLVLTKDLTEGPTQATGTSVDGIEVGGGRINRYAYVLTRAQVQPGTSFTEGSQLTIGEPIVVSSEQGQYALANGYLIGITRSEVTVAVDRKLGEARQRLADFDENTNQAFRGTMDVAGTRANPIPSSTTNRILYRVDKDEFSNGLALVRNNLVALMGNQPLANKLREHIIYDARPSFTPNASGRTELEPTQLGDMNEDQRSAVNKVLAANDYALILGMPGTGKTTTIAHIIRSLLAQDKTILLTSFTHTAVDNILLKIRDIAPPGSILRLGAPAKINARVQEFCQLATTPRKSIDEVDTAYMGSRIVAATCMGTNHALFNCRSFDVCIVDEASQITLPTILGPLLHARKYVLVGDHYQLPPLVQNKAALEGGLDVSLFRQLSETQPESVVELGRQYRMCEEIMSLSNELIYHGKLRCGNEDVARRVLHITSPEALHVYHGMQSSCASTSEPDCWLARATNPMQKVVFANTDRLGTSATETLSGGGKITNNLEATLAAQLVLSLLALGVPGREIGVITLYRSQLALMRQLFRRAGISDSVEIDSADRFQGRDKECIILSMVRSNEVGIVGELLKDWRRVNVALTRARSKLIVLGSRKTLKHNDLLNEMLVMMDKNHWSLDLPQHADDTHTFDFSTQIAEQIVVEQSPSPKKKKTIRSPLKSSQHSPSKKRSSPIKLGSQTARPRKALQDTSNAANRSPSKLSGVVKKLSAGKTPKVITGGKSNMLNRKMKDAREQLVMEIFEDLTGDEF